MHAHRRGFALILVLISVAAVFALAMHSAVSVRTTTVEARVLSERTDALRGARNAAVLAVLGLITEPGQDSPLGELDPLSSVGSGSSAGPSAPEEPKKPSIELPPIIKELIGDALDEVEQGARDATSNPGPISRATDGGGVTGRAKGGFFLLEDIGLPAEPAKVMLPGDPRSYRVSFKDPAGQIDLNDASAEVLERLLLEHRVEPQQARAIVDQVSDWRDDDDFVRPLGAEQSEYGPRGVACRNAPLRAREELLYLPAMTPEIFARIRDDLTTGSNGAVHAGSASREVLASLPGMTPVFADEIIRLRATKTLTEEDLDAIVPIAAREARAALRAAPSNVVRIRVEAVGDSVLVYEGLAILDENGVRAMGLRPM